MQLGLAIAGHRQLWVAVPGQLHRFLECATGSVEHGNIAVPQRMKVAVLRAVGSQGDIGDAGALQIEAQHLGGILGPGAGPDRDAGRLAVEVALQRGGGVGGDGLNGRLAILGVFGSERDGRRLGVEGEVSGSKNGQFAGAVAGDARRQVQMVTVEAGQTAKGAVAVEGRDQHTLQLLRRQRAAGAANVGVGVHTGQAGQGIVARAPIADKPAREALDGADMMVPRRGTDGLTQPFAEGQGGLSRKPPPPALALGRKIPAAHQRADAVRLDAQGGGQLLFGVPLFRRVDGRQRQPLRCQAGQEPLHGR